MRTHFIWLGIAPWLLLVAVAVAALALAAPASAQGGNGVIEARAVVSGTVSPAAVANLPASLFTYVDGQRQPTPLASVTDAQGRVRFEGLNTGSNYTYTVIVRYQETFYRAEHVAFALGSALATPTINLPPPPAANADNAGVRIEQRHLVIEVDPTTRSLAIAEFMQVTNSTVVTYTGAPDAGANNKGVTLRIPLPGDAEDIGVEGRTPDVDVFFAGGALLDTVPIPPGGGGLIFSYRLPYQRSTYAMAIGTPLTTTTLNVLVSAGVGVRGQRLVAQGTVPDTQYTRYTARDLAPGTTLAIELTELPAPLVPLDLLQWMPLAASGLGLAVILFLAMRGRRAA